MMRLAQRLPVGSIPEKLGIAAMRFDVVDNRRLCGKAFLQAHHAERMGCEVLSAGALPL